MGLNLVGIGKRSRTDKPKLMAQYNSATSVQSDLKVVKKQSTGMTVSYHFSQKIKGNEHGVHQFMIFRIANPSIGINQDQIWVFRYDVDLVINM